MAATTKNSASREKRTKGEGSIYQQHNPDCPRPVDGRGNSKCSCRYVGAFVLGWRDDKPIRRKVSGTSRTIVANRIREKRQEYADQQMPIGPSTTVAQWMNYWLNTIAPRKVQASTLENSYRQKVTQYINPLLGHHRLDRLTQEHIEDAWDKLRTIGNPMSDNPSPLSAATVLQTHRILSRALKVAVQRKRLRVNPADTNAMDAPALDQQEMDVLTVDQVKAVMDAAKTDRLEARWVIALAFGLRQGEALGLAWDNVDLDDAVLRVRQGLQRRKGKGLVIGGLKTRRSRRDIALPAELVALLKAHKKAQNIERLAAGSAWADMDLVFTQIDGKPIDPSRDSKSWHRLLDKADVPQVRLHDARHSAATVMLLMGIETRTVMDILGHSQMSVTTKYQHVVDEIKRSAADQIGAALWG